MCTISSHLNILDLKALNEQVIQPQQRDGIRDLKAYKPAHHRSFVMSTKLGQSLLCKEYHCEEHMTALYLV